MYEDNYYIAIVICSTHSQLYLNVILTGTKRKNMKIRLDSNTIQSYVYTR